MSAGVPFGDFLAILLWRLHSGAGTLLVHNAARAQRWR